MLHRIVAVLLCLLVSAWALPEREDDNARVLPIFNVVKFPNDLCSATQGRNGTCYTETECKDKAGTNTGACADGFGVCCSFVLSCGGSTSDNNSYLVQASSTALSGCTYTVCPQATSISRIRYDFTTLELAAPVVGTSVAIGSATPTIPTLGALGTCLTDGMSITSTSGSSPVICGTNTGQHMILDSDGVSCQTVNIYTDSSATSRSWDIWITQYQHPADTSGMGGPPGCLQYFTATSGSVRSFNFPSTLDAGSSVTIAHLNNQRYTTCIRRGFGMTKICYAPKGAAAAAAPQGSYGIGLSIADATSGSLINTSCTADYVGIPGVSTTVTIGGAAITQVLYRHCGRVFNVITGIVQTITAAVTACTTVTPFSVVVNFDDFESLSSADNAIASMATTSELSVLPSGNLGFALIYIQS